MDKQKEFLDKVLERLLKETVITDSKITFPFAIFKQPELTGDSLLSVSQWIDGMWENHKYPHRFSKYCMDIYGLTFMESLGLWNSYMEIIEEEINKRLKRPLSDFYNMDLNESVDKQKEYLDRILERLKSETQFKTTTDNGILRYWWRYPFGNFTTLSPYYPTSQNSHFHKHCRNIYGLSNEEIEDYILPNYYKWFKYNNPMFGFELYENTTINENVDKQKEFLDKVVQHAVERFKDTDKGELQYYIDMDDFIGFGDNFGLTELELNYIYNKYRFLKGWASTDISSFFLDNNNSLDNRRMNESYVDVLPYTNKRDIEFLKDFTKDLNEKQKGYLDKVVEQLLRETDIDYEKWRINYPFFENTTYSFQYTLPFSGPFIRYCNNIFPLSEDEKRYVHFIYTGIIHSKIRKYYVDNDIYNKYYNVMGTKDIINFDR
jgi:hypothetical protein